MDWSRHEATAKRWREQTERYVREINQFVRVGKTQGWDAAGPQPEDPRTDELGDAVADIVQEANEAGRWRELRERLPPAQAPFASRLNEWAVGIRNLSWLDEARVVATVGTAWRPESVWVCGLDGETEVIDALDVGVDPGRRWFALLVGESIRVHDGWGGPVVARLPVPRGDEDAPEGTETPDDRALVEQLIPLPDGSGVVVATSRGAFLVGESTTVRLCPTREELARTVADWKYDEPLGLEEDMVHAAVDPRGRWIACGDQGSQHQVHRVTDGEVVARFGPIHSSYPHHAAFSPDGERAIFNSCHFYNGATCVVRTEDIVGLEVPEYEEHIALLPLDGGCRVYDSSWVDGCFLLGDAHGYVRAVTPGGDGVWGHFVGSSIGGVDVSPSGDRLAVATAAGFLSLCERDDTPDPAQIGDSPFRERIRYVRWKDRPLMRW